MSNLELRAAQMVRSVICNEYVCDDTRFAPVEVAHKVVRWHTSDDMLFEHQEDAIAHQLKVLKGEIDDKD